MSQIKKAQESDSPLSIHTGEVAVLWALVDVNDGTLWCSSVSSNYDRQPSSSHEEVALFTDKAKARLAAADFVLTCGAEDLVPRRVKVLLDE